MTATFRRRLRIPRSDPPIIEIHYDLTYGHRRAGASFYGRVDCKSQICWSLREGGIDYLLAPPRAPNEIGLLNESKLWQFMLLLSKVNDDLRTPGLGAPPEEEMTWMKALFEIHFESARSTLISRMRSGE